ncbi:MULTISPECIES: hypothetical protein [unclassified Chelatococcus]|uniref:hypothetical protein n=1 Tax=unclassified Chelatococcus TaxID=2638111 RepID=UPI001BCAE35D|nr:MULTISPECIES: hypothetical protein [unclassified Chelatococcus]MBS7695734.1 hypothetical protein [Chelatococcus sp. YT9]MBX3557873.1 hypothetical protein [Chelatococcus sp.]
MIRVLTVAVVGCAMSLAVACSAHAGGRPPSGTAGASYATMSEDEIRTSILDACVVTQWQTATSQRDNYADRCGCYARRVTAGMSPDEFNAFRRTGYFSDVTRPKAEAALAACNVKR